MAPIGTHNAVRQLIEHYPEKAAEILVSCCNDERILNEVFRVFIPSSHGPPEPLNPRNSLNINFGPQPPLSPDGSQHSDSPRPFIRRQRYPTPVMRPFPIHSPSSTTSSSVSSHSLRDRATPAEYGVFISLQGRGIEETPLRMRTANVEHSVIRQDIVLKRHLNGIPNQLDQCYVTVTQSTTPHLLEEVQAGSSIDLDWRRPHSEITDRTTFYIVSGDALDTDVLLSCHDSGGSSSDHTATMAPQPQRGQTFMHQQHNPNIRPPVPTPPAQPLRRSTVTYDGSAHATPVPPQQQHQPWQQPAQDFPETLLAQQHPSTAAMGESRHSQGSPAVTVINTHPLHTAHQQPLQPSPIPPHNANQTSTNRLRVNLLWDKTVAPIWLDMSGEAEDFFTTFQQLAEKKKRIFDRANVTICFRRDKLDPNCEEHDLPLDEETLDMDWESTLEWLMENKRDTAPHVFGRVEVGDG